LLWVYKNINRATQQRIPYLLDVQSSLLDDLQTTVVVLLYHSALIGKASITRLCPEVQIEGEKFVALTSQIAGVDRRVLERKVCALSEYHSDIIAAVDFIISGI